MSDQMPDRFDRSRGLLHGLTGVMQTQPSTITVTTPLLGTTDTYIVETFRQRDQPEAGDKPTPALDVIFLQVIRAHEAPIRVAIPPEVANAIARQRDALTTRSRKAGARKAVETRKARGITTGFVKGHKRAKGGTK